ncbi:hypothetical protein BD560DRAFT_420029 [Blakeslea trispora]|nr:hypothetical protein BD560DRAFT_420029 [Blakeslea trispora]
MPYFSRQEEDYKMPWPSHSAFRISSRLSSSYTFRINNHLDNQCPTHANHKRTSRMRLSSTEKTYSMIIDSFSLFLSVLLGIFAILLKKQMFAIYAQHQALSVVRTSPIPKAFFISFNSEPIEIYIQLISSSCQSIRIDPCQRQCLDPFPHRSLKLIFCFLIFMESSKPAQSV